MSMKKNKFECHFTDGEVVITTYLPRAEVFVLINDEKIIINVEDMSFTLDKIQCKHVWKHISDMFEHEINY